jgi:hypothetical protein
LVHDPIRCAAQRWSRSRRSFALITWVTGFAALACVAGACSTRPAEQTYDFVVRVTSGPERPVAGVTVFQGGQAVGVSGADGVIHLRTTGSEGHTLALRVACPEAHKSPAQPLSIVMRRLGAGARAPEYAAHCAPTMRTQVIVVRTENAVPLPIRHLGHEVGRTDETGVAHVLLRTPPEESIELVLDTADQPRLRPQAPTARFEAAAQDALHVFEQRFELQPLPKRARAAKRSTLPIRIQ